jgi:hypothetical protein
MQLIHKFHKMESENKLFDLGKEINLPLWDIIRYSVYLKYYYSEKDRVKLSEPVKHDFKDYFRILIKLLSFIFTVFRKNSKTVILTASRYSNNEGKYYDKSAMPIINALNGNCIVVEPILGKEVAYDFIYDFSDSLRRFSRSKNISDEHFTKINDVLIETLGIGLISYDAINLLVRNFRSDHLFYKAFFSLINNKNLIICTGNPKASILAAKELDIETYLVQHAGIEVDEIDYSYPSEITPQSFILFPDYVLTFGEYWCKNLNVPAKKIIPAGNDYFCNIPKVDLDDSILIVSTIVHGGELSKITLRAAKERPDLKFVYKLHPNEFQCKSEYVEYFKKDVNVAVISNEIDTSVLIAKSQLVVLIVSAVIYEALNQNKKVAVLKKINYKRQLHLSQFNNLYFFDLPEELFKILSEDKVISKVNFYKKTDNDKIKQMFN